MRGDQLKTWTFITNHGAVLACIGEYNQITTREIAASLGITERSVLRIISDLIEAGYVQKQREGRLNRYTINRRRPLRRKEQPDAVVGDLLAILTKTEPTNPN